MDFDDIDIRQIDIVKWLEDIGVDPTRGGARNTTHGWVNLQCPFPECDDNTNHLGINLKTKLFSCWKCGEKGNILKLTKEIMKTDWVNVLRLAKKYQDPNAIIEADDIVFSSKVQMPPGISDNFLPKHIKFLRSRRHNARLLIQKYHLLAGGLVGPYKMRIIIPFYLDGKMVTFTARDITDKAQDTYKSLALSKSVIDPRRIFYNIDNVHGTKALLVEGCTDVWRIGDGAISSSGVKITQYQLEFLAAFGIKTLFIMFDGGKVETDSAFKVANFASGFIDHTEVIELDEGVDPDDLDKSDIKVVRGMLR